MTGEGAESYRADVVGSMLRPSYLMRARVLPVRKGTIPGIKAGLRP